MSARYARRCRVRSQISDGDASHRDGRRVQIVDASARARSTPKNIGRFRVESLLGVGRWARSTRPSARRCSVRSRSRPSANIARPDYLEGLYREPRPASASTCRTDSSPCRTHSSRLMRRSRIAPQTRLSFRELSFSSLLLRIQRPIRMSTSVGREARLKVKGKHSC